MAQDLRQVGWAELAGSAGAVRERSQPDLRLLIERSVWHLHLLLGPDQRSQRDERALLLRCCTETAVDPLTCQQSGDCSPDCRMSFRSMKRVQSLQSLKQIGLRPASVLRLLRGQKARESWQEIAVLGRREGERVNSGDHSVRRKVSAVIQPLLLQLDQAEQVLPHLRPVLEPGAKSRPQGQAA